jgi:transcriptional regulator with XRE-family HTH domain
MRNKEEAGQIDRAAGTRLRTIRKVRGISQEALAAAIGVTFQQVQKYEKGTNRIAISTLVLICRALNCTPMEIIGEDLDRSATATIDTLASHNADLVRRLAEVAKIARLPQRGEMRI